MNGKFIVIEGIDGCGKTTQIDELSKWLPDSGLIKKGSKLITTREPGGSLLGKKQTALGFIQEIFKQSSQSENVEERITNNNHPDFLIIEPDSTLATKNSIPSDSILSGISFFLRNMLSSGEISKKNVRSGDSP